MPRLKLSKVTENIADIYRRKVADTVIEATKKRITNDSLKLITNISDDMRTHIGKLLRQGEQKGRSVSATASTLLKTGLDKGVFKSARVRAYLIARTELHRARQEAALDLYKASDIKMVKWIVIGDNRLCPVCKAKAQTYNIKDIEDQLPPEHPRCRCRVLPADYQMTVTVKKNKKNKVVEQQILPTPKNYLYVVKVKKFKKALDVDEARGKIEKYFKNVTREQLIKDLEDSGLEKARTLGAKDLVPRQRRYHVTIADGRKVPVTAHHPAEAVSIARKLFNLAVSKVEEIQDLEKARPHKYTRREGTKGHYLYYYTTGQKQTSGIKTVGIGIDTKFKEKGFIDLRGQKVTSASDVAQLAQIYRNPKYETMRYIYVKDGIVVGHEGRSSRIPGQSGAFAKEPARELFELRQRIARLGADTVWLVHNHPSTNPKPSKGDLAITTRLMWDIPEIKGHVIINSGKFGLIERAKGPEGTVPVVPSIQMLPFKPSDEFLKPTVDNPLLGQTVQSGWDVAKVAMALKTPKNFATLLYRSGSTIRAIQEVPIKMLTHYEAMLDYMRGRAREFGAMDVLVAAEQGSLPQEAETTLTKMVMYGQIIDGIIYESNEMQSIRDHTLMGSSGSSREEWMGRPAKTYVTKGLEKAQPHKYIRRTGVSGHYEYFYDEPGTIRVGGIAFAQPERAKKHGEQVVLVDVAKFDAEWSKDEGFYVGQGGQGASISDRYERFKEFIKIGKPIEMAEVSGRPGHIGFTNGRHRFAVLRDLGLKVIPISVDKESASYMQDTFGASEEDTGWKPKRGQRERLESSQDIQVRHHKLNQIREEYNLGSFGASKVDVTKAVNYVEEEIERWSGKLHFDGRGILNIEVVKLPQKSGRELRGRYLPLGKILQIDQRFSDSVPHEYAHFIFDANGWRAAWPPRQSVVTGRTYIPTEVRLGFDGFNRTISNADTSEEGKALVELFDSLKEFYASDECAKEINQGFSKVIAMGNIKWFEEYRAHYLDYVFRPTEIFARACEMYANGRPGKAAQMVSKTGPISSPESLPGYRDVVTAWGDKYLKTGIVKSLEKAVGYSRFRHGKLEQVKGYTGKPRLHDLTTGEKLDQYLMDPTRPEVTKAMDIIKNIDKVGGRALMVGGCVRDALLGRHSKDIDIEVYGLKPEELSSLLQQHGSVDQVGKSFGVFKVSSPELEEAIDVSLPRRESKTGKGHKGFMVEPDQQMAIKEAASRRDLTINSMAYDPLTKEFVDPFNGLADLKAGKLQATDPTTFPDDSLRVLRVMRFAAQLGFTPTVELARLCRDIDLTDLPKERVFGEFSRMLAKAKHPSIGLQLIPILGIGKILPELTALKGVEQEPDWHPEGDAWTHTLMVVDEAAKIRDRLTDPKEKLIFMLGALCHDLGKPVTTEVQDGKIISHSHDSVGADIATKFLARLTDEPYIVDKVVSLVQNHMRPTFFLQDKVPDSAIRRLAKKVDIPMLVMVSASDKSGRGLKADLKAERWLMRRFKVLGLEHPETLEPRVRGRDLIPLGVPPGPGMGRILDKIYNAQLEGKFETTEQGLEYAKQQGWFLPVEMADTMTKSMRGLTVGYREARSLIRQLRKNRLEDKFIPYREGGDIVWAKHSDNGLILNRPAIKGDTVLMKSGVLATVTAVGKDGITARREGEKFNLFNGTFDVVSK